MGKNGVVAFRPNEVTVLQPFLDKTVVCLILGPSGVGKGTAIQSLVSLPHFPCTQLVRYTTRQKWPEDKEGYQYHFVSQTTFDEMILREALLEWRSYGTSYYGTGREKFISTFRKEGIILIDVNLHMALDLKYLCQEAGIRYVDILITPGNPALLTTESGVEEALAILRERITQRMRGEQTEEIE